ncbi:MAG: MFS transporter [Halobacteriales archaeon]|nr:MFS transporter [Halobacteriales archaeon]
MSVVARRGSRRFVVGAVSLAHFLSHFYFLVFPPLFPLFREEFGVSNTQLGLLFSLLFLMPTVLQIPVGDLVDRTGAKRVFVVGLALTGLGTTATALADSYLALLGFVLLAGVGQSAFHPADFALLETVSDASNRGKGFGAHTFAGFLGFAAGPLVAGGLGVRFGWRAALAGLGLVGLAYAAAAWLVLAPVHAGTGTAEDTGGNDGPLANWGQLADPRVALTVLFFVVITVAGTGTQSFTVVFLTDAVGLGVAAANNTLSANLAAAAVGVLAGGVLADRFDIYRTIAVTLLVATGLTALIAIGAVPPTLLAVGVAFVALGLFHGLALPSRDSLVSEFAEQGTAGKSFGLAYTGVTVGAFIAPVLFGFVSDTAGNRVMFGLVGAFYVAAVLTVLALSVGYARHDGRPA